MVIKLVTSATQWFLECWRCWGVIELFR